MKHLHALQSSGGAGSRSQLAAAVRDVEQELRGLRHELAGGAR